MIKNVKNAKNYEKKTECLDDTSPVEIEEDVSDSKNYNSENNDKKKTGCLDDTSPEEMEDDVCDEKNDNRENIDKKKELGCLDDTSPEETEDDVFKILEDHYAIITMIAYWSFGILTKAPNTAVTGSIPFQQTLESSRTSCGKQLPRTNSTCVCPAQQRP